MLLIFYFFCVYISKWLKINYLLGIFFTNTLLIAYCINLTLLKFEIQYIFNLIKDYLIF